MQCNFKMFDYTRDAAFQKVMLQPGSSYKMCIIIRLIIKMKSGHLVIIVLLHGCFKYNQ